MTYRLPPALAALAEFYELDEAGRQVVHRAYKVFHDHHGPFITFVVAKMLPDLRRDAEAGRTIVFLGRDGHSLAAAAKALRPGFFAKYCREAVISRTVVEAALQDLEFFLGRSFPRVEGFRQARNKVEPHSIQGSYRRLTDYLRAVGVLVGKEGGAVTLVNTSFKGTIQEILAAIYPSTQFIGRYAFFGASPEDPHPGSKTGYVVHLSAERTAGGQGVPFSELPREPELTFACREAIAVIEHTLHGPLTSPRSMSSLGPSQQGQRHNPTAWTDPNRASGHPRFRDPVVRDAVKAAALMAVYDAAAEVAILQDADDQEADRDLLGRMAEQPRAFTEQTRAWVGRERQVDPELKVVLDSLVQRSKSVPSPA